MRYPSQPALPPASGNFDPAGQVPDFLRQYLAGLGIQENAFGPSVPSAPFPMMDQAAGAGAGFDFAALSGRDDFMSRILMALLAPADQAITQAFGG